MSRLPKLKIRRGFAIPAVILTLVIMSIMIAAGFSLVNSEHRGVIDQKAQISAFMIAEHGLQTFLVRRDSLGFRTSPPADREGPVRIRVPGGYADVQMDKVRVPTSLLLGLYAVRARGVMDGTPPAVRTVAQYVEWHPATIDIQSAWTSLSGIKKTGLLGTFSGNDACGDSASIPGLGAVGGVVSGLGLVSLSSIVDSVKNIGSSPATAADNLLMKWQGIVDGTALTPDYTLPGNAIPSFADATFFPTIKVEGNLSAASGLSGGRGLLIVTGDVNFNVSAFNWEGLILIGGKISGNFPGNIEGAVISGLNLKLGETVETSVAEGYKTMRYSSCAVANALKGFGTLVPLSNAWVDNWVEY